MLLFWEIRVSVEHVARETLIGLDRNGKETNVFDFMTPFEVGAHAEDLCR